MPVEQTLHKAAEEVTRGDLANVLRARQRLAGLVGTYPNRLDIRDRLAGIYRVLGEPAQAGRWSYLSEVRDEAEVAAFERAYRNPMARLAALCWVGGEQSAATETARARLIRLHAAASEQIRGELAVVPEDDASWLSCAMVSLGLAVLTLCFVTGAVTLAVYAYRWFTG